MVKIPTMEVLEGRDRINLPIMCFKDEAPDFSHERQLVGNLLESNLPEAEIYRFVDSLKLNKTKT